MNHTMRRRKLQVTISVFILAFAVMVPMFTWYGALATFLALACLLRLYSLLRSVWWIWFDGPVFARLANLDPGFNSASPVGVTLPVYQLSGGDFFPFGIRAIVLEAARQSARGAKRSLFSAAYKMWKLYFFVPMVSVCIIVDVEILDRNRMEAGYNVGRIGLLVCCLALLAAALVIAAEAALSYLIFGSWSLSHHRFDVQAERSVTEFAVFAGAIITTVLSCMTAIYGGARLFHAFADVPPTLDTPALIGKSFYFTITMLTGNGDPGPRGIVGFLSVGLIYVLAGALIIIVFSLLLESLGNTTSGVRRRPRLAWEHRNRFSSSKRGAYEQIARNEADQTISGDGLHEPASVRAVAPRQSEVGATHVLFGVGIGVAAALLANRIRSRTSGR